MAANRAGRWLVGKESSISQQNEQLRVPVSSALFTDSQARHCLGLSTRVYSSLPWVDLISMDDPSVVALTSATLSSCWLHWGDVSVPRDADLPYQALWFSQEPR